MKFLVAESKHPKLAPVGSILTLEQAAQLLELNASEMAQRSKTAAAVYSPDVGILLEVVRGKAPPL